MWLKVTVCKKLANSTWIFMEVSAKNLGVIIRTVRGTGRAGYSLRKTFKYQKTTWTGKTCIEELDRVQPVN